MISSKRITVVAVIFIVIALVFTASAMFIQFNNAMIIGSSRQDIVTYTDDDYYSDYSKDDYVTIELKGDTAVSDSSNVSIAGSEITILGGGTYVISGELTDGCITVNSDDGAEVRLVLSSVNITSSDFSAIYIKESGKTVISLDDGTENFLTDGCVYSEEKLEDGKPTAALYSKDDLTVNGGGTLTVTGNYEDGIKVNDTMKVTGGTICITAADDGINVNDYFAVKDSSIKITSGGDAVKCENDNEEKGSIALEKTDVSIVSSGDGIYASSSIYAYDVTATITAGGGAAAAEPKNSGEKRPGMAEIEQETDESTSTKGVKAGVDLIIDSGSYTIDSADDAIHSDGDLGINGGNFTISTGDDAVHADFNVDVSPENMNITCCYEGIEGEYVIINGGSISIISNDDAINATGENSANGFGGGPGMMGSESKTAEEDIYLTINDGDIYIETSGDGIDSNGSAVVNGGRIEIYGPEDSGNGSIDVGDGGYVFIMNGGSLIAAGSSGMAECPYSGSEQNVLVFYLETACEAGSFVSVTDSAGNEVISGTVNKSFDFICVSDSAIIQGETYTLYINGTETASLEASETVSVSGTAAGGMSRGGMGRRQQQ